MSSISSPYNDVVEGRVRTAERRTREATGMGLFHWLTIGTAAASLTLYLLGKKNLAIFVGLWPPTIQSLRPRS